jgi:hypothetical protein
MADVQDTLFSVRNSKDSFPAMKLRNSCWAVAASDFPNLFPDYRRLDKVELVKYIILRFGYAR